MTSCASLNVKGIVGFWLGLAIWFALDGRNAGAEEFSIESAGGRFGFPATHGSEDFRTAEAFLNCNLPASWDLGNDFLLKMRMDFTAGWLGRSQEDAFTSSAGPALALRYNHVPLWLEGGSSPTLISRHDFGRKDLGGAFQFTTHIGLSWDITRHWRLGYRYEHISNAGAETPNPGVNLHTFALGYLF